MYLSSLPLRNVKVQDQPLHVTAPWSLQNAPTQIAVK